MAGQVVMPGAKRGQASCRAQVRPLPPADSSHPSDNHQTLSLCTRPCCEFFTYTLSLNPRNDLAGGHCYYPHFRGRKLRHREVYCLWSSDWNPGS